MSTYIVVFVTVSSAVEGEKLASVLVGERLAACVNRLGPVQSTYWWQGRVERDDEQLLVIKTRDDLFDQLKARVQELHSYSVPEVIALPILKGSESYLHWMDEELAKAKK
jgi:periplasmic divalent cation tolerance protein